MTDYQIHATVIVEIANGQAAGEAVVAEIHPARRGHGLEAAVAHVAEQDRPLSAPGIARGKALKAPRGNEQVQAAVIVPIQESGPPPREVLTTGREAGRLRSKPE